MLNTTEFRTVTCKGVDWLVAADGRIAVPERISEYRRTRNGIEQVMVSRRKAQLISSYSDKSGYAEVATLTGGKRIKARVHRLVALAFVAGYVDGLTVNHINGIKTDNRAENLEWVSLARNTEHQWQTGLIDHRGELSPRAKLTTRQVVYIRRLLADGVAAHALSVVAGVSMRTIAMIRDGHRWASVPA